MRHAIWKTIRKNKKCWNFRTLEIGGMQKVPKDFLFWLQEIFRWKFRWLQKINYRKFLQKRTLKTILNVENDFLQFCLLRHLPKIILAKNIPNKLAASFFYSDWIKYDYLCSNSYNGTLINKGYDMNHCK